MHTTEAKQIIKNTLKNNIKFNGHFSKCFENIKESQQKEIIEWIKNCKEYKISPIQSKTNKNIIGFVKKIGTNLRAILTKSSARLKASEQLHHAKKDNYFIALFLDKHKYYEFEMNKFGF